MTHPMLDIDAWDSVNPAVGALVIADGQSVTVNCYGGGSNQPPAMLVVNDGPPRKPRKREFARVPRVLRHLAILQPHGYVSGDAMRWMADVGVTWSVYDRRGKSPRTLATSGGCVNPHYLRRQALCAPGMPYAYTGVRVMRHLIGRKLDGQADNLERVLGLEVDAKEIRELIPRVERARSVETIMGLEGNAADTYWECWRQLPVVWERAQAQPHWSRFPSRKTLRRTWESNRNATDPVNAMLNFGYKVAETECALACYAHALSPAMGMGHVDRDKRDSFALDLIEVMRPKVDRVILDILAERLNDQWFSADREGVVTLRAPLTHRILKGVHEESRVIVQSLFTIIALLDGVKRRVATRG